MEEEAGEGEELGSKEGQAAWKAPSGEGIRERKERARMTEIQSVIEELSKESDRLNDPQVRSQMVERAKHLIDLLEHPNGEEQIDPHM